MKNFNWRIFRVGTFIVILLTFFSWVGLESINSQNGSDILWWAVGSSWTILRFPIFTLYWYFLFDHNNLFLFSLAVFFNCAFYGFVIERIFSFRRRMSKLSPVSSEISG